MVSCMAHRRHCLRTRHVYTLINQQPNKRSIYPENVNLNNTL